MKRRPSEQSRLGALQPAGLDPLILAIAGSMLAYVWRIQDLYPILATVQFPVLATLAAIGFYLMDKDPRRAVKTIRHPITYLIVGIFVLAVLSVPTSVYQGRSLGFITDDLSKSLLLAALLAASTRTFEDVRRYAAVLLIGGILYAQFVYFNVAVGMSGRLGNLAYYDANGLGMLLVCTIPIALFFVLRGRTWASRGMGLIALPLFVLVIVKSGSRGAFLGLIAVSLYLLLQFRAVSLRTRILAVSAAFGMLMLVGSETYWDMMATLLNPQDDYNWSGGSESGRMEVWKRGMGYMLSNPITGVGVRGFPIAEGMISELADRQQYGIGLKWSAAHNSFVEIGAELGVFGLLLLIMLVARAYWAARSVDTGVRGERSSDNAVLGHALAAAVVGYLVSGFFLSQAYSVYMYTIYALIVGLVLVTGRDRRVARRPFPGRKRRAGTIPRSRRRSTV